MATAVFVLCLCSSTTHRRSIMEVQRDIVEFEALHKLLFTVLMIDSTGKQTFKDHLQIVMKSEHRKFSFKLVWHYTVFHCIWIHRHLRSVATTGCIYEQKTSLAPVVKQHHKEPAHPASVHVDLIVDATTMKPNQIPPQLTGKNTVDHVLY